MHWIIISMMYSSYENNWLLFWNNKLLERHKVKSIRMIMQLTLFRMSNKWNEKKHGPHQWHLTTMNHIFALTSLNNDIYNYTSRFMKSPHYFPLKKKISGPPFVKWKNLNSLHTRLLCVMFCRNWPSGYWRQTMDDRGPE